MNGEIQQGRIAVGSARRYLLGGLAAFLLVSLALLPGVFSRQPAHAAPAATTVTESVAPLYTAGPPIPGPSATGFLGANVPQYVPAWLGTNDAGTSAAALAAVAGLMSMRFPGGSNADYYQWESNTAYATPNFNPFHDYSNYVDPSMNFDAFMNQVLRVTAAEGTGRSANNPTTDTDITVNYGSGTAAEAASWVAYANKNMVGYSPSVPKPSYAGASATGHAYGIKYWEIGNEDYGDGTYGTSTNPAHWEYDTTPGPAAYGQAVVSYSTAMKAVDSTIQVGAVLTANGNFPDGVTNANSPQSWNTTVLSTPGVCNAINFVAIHWYAQQPNAESDAGLLAAPLHGISGNTPALSTITAQTKAELQQYCPGKSIAIRVTEANSVNANPGKQSVGPVNAIFEESTIADLYVQGVQGVNWWGFVNGFYQYPDEVPPGATFPFNPGNLSSSLYGTAQYGDYGLLSDGSSYQVLNADGVTTTTISEPDELAPFPSYFGMQLLGRYLGTGLLSNMSLSNTSSNSLVLGYAVVRSNTLYLLITNASPTLVASPVINLPAGEGASSTSGFSYVYNPTNGDTGLGGGTLTTTVGATQVNGPTLYPYGSEVVEVPIS